MQLEPLCPHAGPCATLPHAAVAPRPFCDVPGEQDGRVGTGAISRGRGNQDSLLEGG